MSALSLVSIFNEYPNEEEEKQFEVVWKEQDAFGGLDIKEIPDVLMVDYKYYKAKRRRFMTWFFVKGMKEGWLLSEFSIV